LLGVWQIEQILDEKGNVIMEASQKDSLIAKGLAEDRNSYQMNEIQFTAEDSLQSIKESEIMLKILFETRYEFGKGGVCKIHTWIIRQNIEAVTLEGTYKFDEKTSTIERSITNGDQKQEGLIHVEWLADGRMKWSNPNNTQFMVFRKIE
jgi:hypothetical protein